jgi:hypothetical protein
LIFQHTSPLRGAEKVYQWWVNPWLVYGNFRTGLMIEGDFKADGAVTPKTDNSKIKYRLPIHAAFAF